MPEETTQILKTSIKECASTELHVFDLGMKCCISINHTQMLNLFIIQFNCFNCLATVFADTHMHNHINQLFAAFTAVWYLVVKEKVQKYKNKSLMQLVAVAEGGRKKSCF